MPTILLVEDQTIVREGLRRLLETVDNLQVVAEADSVQTAVSEYIRTRPELVLMDLKLGAQSGLDASRGILAVDPQARIMALTAYDDFPMVEEAFKVGLLGYAPKQCTLMDLCRGLEAVQAGQQYVHPAILPVVLTGMRHHSSVGATRLAPTAEELHLLTLLAEGLSYSKIAARVFLSERTIRRRVQNLLDHLQVANTAQAVALAVKQGWLRP